jgi:hypothetical protein
VWLQVVQFGNAIELVELFYATIGDAIELVELFYATIRNTIELVELLYATIELAYDCKSYGVIERLNF